jgi:hypothetical protein
LKIRLLKLFYFLTVNSFPEKEKILFLICFFAYRNKVNLAKLNIRLK